MNNTEETTPPTDQQEIAPEQWIAFFEECFQSLADVTQLMVKLEKNDSELNSLLDPIFRKVHTIKGGLSLVPNSQELASILHSMESIFADFKDESAQIDFKNFDFFYFLLNHIQSHLHDLQNGVTFTELQLEEQKLIQFALLKIKLQSGSLANVKPFWHKQDLTQEDKFSKDGTFISNEKLENLEKLSNELIIVRNLFQMSLRDANIRSNAHAFDQFTQEFSQNLSKVTDQLQLQISDSLNIEFSQVAGRLPRLIRQTAASCGKEVSFEVFGFKTLVDRKLAQNLFDSLVHMVRNAIDHGIETPQEREELGKPPRGTLKVNLWESEGILKLKIKDDGEGIDVEKVRNKAIKSKLTTAEQADKLSKNEILKFIFHPGFSTKDNATSVSGRGVGLDVVDNFVKSYHGQIYIQSQTGTGTEIVLEIPPPRKVMVRKTILTQSNGLQFAFPLEAVESMESCHRLKITSIDHIRIVQLNDSSIPALSIDELKGKKLLMSEEEFRKKSLVIIKVMKRSLAIVVDHIDQQIEMVIRPFSPFLKKMKGFSGSAILGQDQIAYLVSTEELAEIMTSADEMHSHSNLPDNSQPKSRRAS